MGTKEEVRLELMNTKLGDGTNCELESPTDAMEEPSEETRGGDASVRTGARQFARCVVVVAVLVTCFGVVTTPKLLTSTRASNFDAPPDSPSLQAQQQVEQVFPLFAHGAPGQLIVIVRALPGQPTVLTNEVAQWSQNVRVKAMHDYRVSPFRPLVIGYYLGVPILGVGARDNILKDGYVSNDQKTTLLHFLAIQLPPTHDGNHWHKVWVWRYHLMSFMHEICANPPAGTELILTGNPVVEYERVYDHSIELLMCAELKVLPLAFLVLAYLVRRARLLIVPLISLVVSFVAACMMVLPVASKMTLSPDVPPSILSVTMALSLDYSLFILSRFNENVARRLSLQSNIDIIVSQTGYTITVSALLIAIAFFGATSLPEANLRGAGVGLGITTLTNLIVNISLTPALLLLYGDWFIRPLPCSADIEEQGDSRVSTVKSSANSRWNDLMHIIQKRPMTAILVVTVLLLPLLIFAAMLRTTADTYAVLPDDLASVHGLKVLQKDFPPGRFDPYGVMVTATSTAAQKVTWNGKEGFDLLVGLCDRIHRVGGIAATLGPVWMMKQRVDWEQSLRLQNTSAPWKIRTIYKDILRTHINKSSALLQLHTDFLPRGSGAAEWTQNLREVLEAWEAENPGFEVLLSGGATLQEDIRKTVMDAMPRYLGVSVLGIMLVVFFMFGSVVLPLRLAFALLLTLAATLGIATIVYQTPLLHGTFPWLKDYNGITFQTVPIATCVAVALGLDYDIFLVSRITEYRIQGFSDADSIRKGVSRTGGVISAAGIIMALAFSGLFFSNKLMHQQFACILVVSVLLDTFVVRTVLVPSMMFMAQGFNWWPRVMPEARLVSCDTMTDEEIE